MTIAAARSIKPVYAIGMIAALLSLEAASGVIFSYRSIQSWIVMSVVNFAASLCLLTILCWRASTAKALRLQWLLLAFGVAIWILALVLWTWILLGYQGNGQSHQEIANLSNWLFLYSLVPFFIALSIPGGKAYPGLYFSIDALQYAVAGYLAYLIFYRIGPFTSVSSILNRYYGLLSLGDLQTNVLAIASMLRFLASTETKERNFYRVFFQALLLDAILGFVHGLFLAHHHILVGRVINSAGWWIYSLLFFYQYNEEETETAVVKINPSTVVFLDLASPLFITFFSLVLAVYVARNRFWAGTLSLLANFVLFGLRATLLQARYVRVQTSLQEARDRLEDLSLKDALTGIANRRCFDRVLEAEWGRAVRGQHALSLLLIDVDYFKKLNDHYGHLAGDECLVQIANALQSALPRKSDLLARYGGEEFSVILPETDQQGAQIVAARMQKAVDELQIVNKSAISDYVTISIGLATYEFPREGSSNNLLEASDQALYRAKNNGRNRIELMLVSAG